MFGPLLKGFIGGNVKTTFRQIRVQAICWAVIGLALLCALVFAHVGVYLALAYTVGRIAAAVIICGFWLLVAIIMLVVMKIVAKRAERKRRLQMDKEQRSMLLVSMLGLVPPLVKRYPTLLAAIPVVGLAALLLQNGKQGENYEQKSNLPRD